MFFRFLVLIKMSKIENIIAFFKKESFRFHERIETKMSKFAFINELVTLFLTYELLIYSLHHVIFMFNHESLGPTIQTIFQSGLVILQSQNYSPIFHLTMSVSGFFMSVLYVIQMISVKMKMRSRYLIELLDLMFVIGSLIVFVSPAYLLILPMHLINLFSGTCPPPYSIIILVLLPFTIMFVASCLFINSKRALVTHYHIFIPVIQYMGYQGIPFNGIVAALALLSFWRSTWKSQKLFNLIIFSINLWVVGEYVNAQFTAIEEMMGLIIVIWVTIGFAAGGQKEQSLQEEIENLQSLIKSIEKPETKNQEHLIECLYMEHFINCGAQPGSFCASYTSSLSRKPILHLSKQQLMTMLEEKIAVDFDRTGSKEIQICLTQFRFHNKGKYLKLFKSSFEKMKELQNKSYVTAYEHFKMLSKFQRRLEKQTLNNIIIFQQIQNLIEQDNIFNEMLQQLNRLRSLWISIKVGDYNQFDNDLIVIVTAGQEIQKRYQVLIQTHRMSNQKITLYDTFCNVFSRHKINNHSSVELATQDQHPNYIILLGNIIQKVSRGFELQYNYNEAELKNQHFSSLLPKGLQCMHQNKIKNWDGGQLTNHTNKIMVNGHGFIKYFQFSLLIFPDFEEGLKYIGYFEPLSEKLLFLYNIQDDHFGGISEDFAIFIQSQGMQSETIRQLRCQDIFNGIDMKSSSLRERLKSSLICNISKQKGTSSSVNIKLIKQYQSESGFYALLCLMKNSVVEEAKGQIASFNQQVKNSKIGVSLSKSTERTKMNERVTQAKQQIRRHAKSIKIIFAINFVYLLVCASFLTYSFYMANDRLAKFLVTQQQTRLKLQIRLLFTQIVLRNTQLYTLQLPSNHLDPMTTFFLQMDCKQVIQDRVNSVNNNVLSRLTYKDHNEIISTIQLVIDDQQQMGSINTILQNVQKVSYLMDLPESEVINDGFDDNIPGVVTTSILMISFVIIDLVLTTKIEAPIPVLRSMLIKTKVQTINKKVKQVQNVMAMFNITQNEKYDVQFFVHTSKNIKEKKFSNRILGKVLKSNKHMLIICLTCLLFMPVLCFLEWANKAQGVLLDQIQIIFFRKSIQIQKLIFFTHLHFIDKSMNMNEPTRGYLMFRNQLDLMNTRNPFQFNLLALDDLYTQLSKDICKTVYSNDPQSQFICKGIANGTLTYGLFKSIYRLQFMLQSINTIPDVSDRYKDGQLLQSEMLSYALSQFNKEAYFKYTQSIQTLVLAELDRNLMGYLGLLSIIGVFFFTIGWDKQMKIKRVNFLKQIFVLTPNEQFQTTKTVMILGRPQDLIDIVKGL